MVYKRYIKVGGRTYGPYYYESYRVNGKVRKRIVSPKQAERKQTPKFSPQLILIILGLVLFLGGAYFAYHSISGKATSDVSNPEDNSAQSDVVQNADSALSSSTKDNSNKDSKDAAKDSKKEEKINPSADSNGKSESGGGDKSKQSDAAAGDSSTPEVSAPGAINWGVHQLAESENNSKPLAENNSTDNSVNPENESSLDAIGINQTIADNETENTTLENNTALENNETLESNITSNQTPESKVTLPETNESLGQASGQNASEVINETLTNENIAENATSANLSFIKQISNLRIGRNENASLNLSEYFTGVESYELAAENISHLVDGEIMILWANEGFSGSRLANVTGYSGNSSISSNEFSILVSSRNISIKTSRSPITIGSKVKWTKNVTLDAPENITIELPKEAENVSVRKIEGNQEKEARADITGITGNVVSVGRGESRLFAFVRSLFTSLTGFVIENVRAESTISSGDSNESDVVEVTLQDNATSYTIEYYTDAPQAREEETSYGKKVVVSGPDGLNYTDVTSFANISEKLKVGQESQIKVYWEEEYRYVDFDAYDIDGNGYLDYVEWTTPHLSNQTFEIIFISKADYLDENRSLIENVYDFVKALDSNWTTIPEGDYLRVTFEQNLTSDRDITVYARAICAENSTVIVNGTAIPCEIYKKKLRLDELRRQA